MRLDVRFAESGEACAFATHFLQSKGYLIKADVYLNCAREIAAEGEGKLARQCNKKSAVFPNPLPPDLSNYL